MPKLRLQRVILFARDIDRLTAYYRDILGLEIRGGSTKEGWVDFGALALHAGKPAAGTSKIAFFAKDVGQAREDLLKRGAKLGKVRDFGGLVLCDGEDPEGNRIQLSNRP